MRIDKSEILLLIFTHKPQAALSGALNGKLQTASVRDNGNSISDFGNKF